MSQHKYNDAYNKGFEDGKKKAFDDWVYQCYDELSPKEQIELLLSKGADLPTVEAVPLSVIEDIKAEIEKAYKHQRIVQGTKWTNGLLCAVEIIDRKIAEVKGDKT